MPPITHQFYTDKAKKHMHMDTKVMYRNLMATLPEKNKKTENNSMSTVLRLNKSWYIHTKEYSVALKNEQL